MRLCFNVMLLLALWLAIGALPASAEVLKVDFGADGQQVMSYFSAFTYEEDPSEDSVTKQYDSTLGTGGSVDVTISTNDGKYLDFRNRGYNSTIMGDLIEDHVKAGEGTNGGDKLYLTLGHLKAGQYTITTYHHDSAGATCSIDVLLDDDNDSGQSIATVVQSYGFDNPAMTVTFDFFANGADSIKITLDEIPGGSFQEAVLNGFELTSVPEPGAIILLVSGIACLAACGCWRRKRLGC